MGVPDGILGCPVFEDMWVSGIVMDGIFGCPGLKKGIGMGVFGIRPRGGDPVKWCFDRGWRGPFPVDHLVEHIFHVIKLQRCFFCSQRFV